MHIDTCIFWSWPLYRHRHMGVSVSATINLLNVIHSPGWQHINATLASRCTLVQSDLTGAANNFSRIMLRPEQSTERFRLLFNNLWGTSYAHLTFSIRPSRGLVNKRITNIKHGYKRSILHCTFNPFSVTASSAYTSRYMTHLSTWGSTTAWNSLHECKKALWLQMLGHEISLFNQCLAAKQ